MTEKLPTHVAYADESYYTKERYRSIAVITLAAEYHDQIKQRFCECIRSSGIREFKWAKLRQARERFAAFKIIDASIELAVNKRLRIDVLIWDTQDSRHRIRGRDDIANLERMYYHLFKNVLQRRWPFDSTWHIFPDENSALDWISVQDYLDSAGFSINVETNLFEPKPFSIRLSRDFQIFKIQEIVSADEPICQVADFFAGIGKYSYSVCAKYMNWLATKHGQLTFEFGSNLDFSLSNSERERLCVMEYLDKRCKNYKLHVGLASSSGFKTYDPRFPLNFWLYAPQHSGERAPIKEHGG